MFQEAIKNMGLDDLIDDGARKNTRKYKRYGSHEKDDLIWEIIDEMQDRFPVEIECDMVEVATKDVDYDAKAYWKGSNPVVQYMRVKEAVVYGDPVYLRHVVLHEMVHLYLYQSGYENISDGSHMFKWLCGRVGCSLSQHQMEWNSMMWKDLADPFLDGDMVSNRY